MAVSISVLILKKFEMILISNIAPTAIRRSIPQIDGPSSPPLPAIDSAIQITRSPTSRKRLQKVNRSKSPSSMIKSSSSSLRRIFQNSKVEGLEGEIRDLKTEVRDLKNMVDDLGKELEVAKILGQKACEMFVQLEEKMEDVWGTLYGKGQCGEKDSEESDWESIGDIESTREVGDVGLLRAVWRMMRDIDEKEEEEESSKQFWKGRGIEPYEADLMLPTPTKNLNRGEDKTSLRTDIPISLEQIALAVRESRGEKSSAEMEAINRAMMVSFRIFAFSLTIFLELYNSNFQTGRPCCRS